MRPTGDAGEAGDHKSIKHQATTSPAMETKLKDPSKHVATLKPWPLAMNTPKLKGSGARFRVSSLEGGLGIRGCLLRGGTNLAVGQLLRSFKGNHREMNYIFLFFLQAFRFAQGSHLRLLHDSLRIAWTKNWGLRSLPGGVGPAVC